MHSLFQIDRVSDCAPRSQPRLARDAGIDQRQFHVVQRRGAGQQIEGLKDEPDFLVADARKLVVVHFADPSLPFR